MTGDRPSPSPSTLALVAAAGAVGAALRYGLDVAAPTALSGTLTANVLGSLALGGLVAADLPRRTRLVLGGGLVSSLTTFSTVALQAVRASPPTAVVYLAVSLALGVAAAAVGRRAVARTDHAGASAAPERESDADTGPDASSGGGRE